jgi:hypothetical protein
MWLNPVPLSHEPRGPDPTGKPLILRMVTTLQGADRLLFRMYRVGADGTEALVTEMAHVRTSK